MTRKKQTLPKIVVNVTKDNLIEVEMEDPGYFNARNMYRVTRQINRQRKFLIKLMLREARTKLTEEKEDGA
jgi:hypothetical protein